MRVHERYGAAAGRARRRLRHLPGARRHPRARQGAGPAAERHRPAGHRVRRLERRERRRGAAASCRASPSAPATSASAPSTSWRARSPASPATSRSTPAAWSSPTGPLDRLVPLQPAAMDGAHDLPVGQGLLRRRRLPEDRPARARACCRPSSRAWRSWAGRRASTSTSRASRSTTPRCTRRSRPRTRSASSRSSRARRCRCCCARGRSASTTSWWRSRWCGPARSRAAPCTPTCSGCRPLRDDPSFPVPYDHPLLEEALAETLGVIVFQDQVLDVAAGARRLHRRARPRRCGGR